MNDPEKIAERTKEYEARFLSPFVAAERGYIDEVILPHANSAAAALRALAMLRNKKPRRTRGRSTDNIRRCEWS